MGWTHILTLLLVLLPTLGLFCLHCLKSFKRNGVDDGSVACLIRQQRSVADFSAFDHGITNLSSRLLYRSLPNQRLLSVFGIQNSFTTTSVTVHKEFLSKASRRIREAMTDHSRWAVLHRTATQTLDYVVQQLDEESQHRLPVASTVRVVSFATVLEFLWPQTIDFSQHLPEMFAATEAINRLWLLSKEPTGVERSSGPSPDTEQTRLRNAISSLGIPQDDDPLALIMPSYETLWRIVLLAFVEVGFRTKDSDRDMKEVLDEMMNTIPECLGFEGQDKASNSFAREALRLFPPTKRIYRKTKAEGETYAADIEGIHHDERIFSAPLSFKPRRFLTDMTQEQKDAFIPFGAGRNMCPAAKGFGERMIALLVATLLQRFGTSLWSSDQGAHGHGEAAYKSKWKIDFSDAELDDFPSNPLPTGRGDMEAWVLIAD